MTSRLAFATIWMTWRSFPPPTFALPCAFACAALGAPDNADNVPAKAEVDQLGRLEARGEATDWAGFDEKWVNS